ncbi:hypothetical protein E2C01_094714 [Portunus trituberculatus]|uniref:Uncharacterized protein n=1 Tax=Portunus trituberculatus TaxID=210409 RepID=A0A5B7K2F0_PORTR|nr:hypothetical protein [Portunus trituberculatus]
MPFHSQERERIASSLRHAISLSTPGHSPDQAPQTPRGTKGMRLSHSCAFLNDCRARPEERESVRLGDIQRGSKM